MAGLVSKLWEGLSRTRSSLMDGLVRTFSGRSRLDDEALELLEERLIATDMGVDTALSVIEAVQKQLNGRSEMQWLALLKQELLARLQKVHQNNGRLKAVDSLPLVIMVTGVNGVGKTTTIGKLAYYFTQQGKKVVVGAADTFRAAAQEQLQIWAERAGAGVVKNKPGADPASVAYDTIDAAVHRGMDVAIIDTAGRLHTKSNLMEELKKIKRVIGRRKMDAPHEVLLVLDATTGQNGLSQARQFHEAVGITGIVLTKLDGTAKGGIVFAIQQELQVPVKFVGVGEKITDLEPFNPEVYVEALFA